MANYDLDTQQVRDSILASGLSSSLKNAISSLLGNAASLTLDNFSPEIDATVSITRTTDFASAQSGGKYTATSDTGVIIIDGDGATELNVNIENSSSNIVIVGGAGADTITLKEATVRASADGTVGGATISGSAGDDVILVLSATTPSTAALAMTS